MKCFITFLNTEKRARHRTDNGVFLDEIRNLDHGTLSGQDEEIKSKHRHGYELLLSCSSSLSFCSSHVQFLNDYLTNRFLIAVRLLSNRSKMTSNRITTINVAHQTIDGCATKVLTTCWCPL